ncbi:MAG: hypothetical protein K2X69_09680 [Silvanigrellaceae bacterium]|nr:hypothetical protein [Silvanigrellaceae bacterium]
MKINHVLNKVTALFSTGLMLSTPFQSYVYASGISKLTAVVYSSAEGAKSTQKVAKTTGAELSGTSAYAQSTSGNQGGGDSNKPVSDAYNYKDLSQSVDPRTGAFSLSYKIGDVVGNGFEDPEISLSINYSSLSSSDIYGLGKGWSWNLSHYDTKSGMLSLASGGSYKLDIGTGKLKYYKLKDLNVTIGSDYVTLKYKDGRIEQIDRAFGNLRKITNVQGFSAELTYEKGSRIQSIIYKSPVNGDNIKKLEITYPSDTEVRIKKNDGSAFGSPLTVLKKSANSLLTSIVNPLSQEVKFEYKALTEKNFATEGLITDIFYPTGTKINVIYLPGGLESAKKGVASPAVSKIRTISLPKTDNSDEEIRYTYYESTNTNYLAYGFTGFKEGEDTLFFTPNTYTYSTVETKKAPDNKTISTERVYNHFHQMIKEIVRINGEYSQVKEFTYPLWANKSFDALDPNYNFPKETKTIFYANGMQRSVSTKQEYDIFGNILRTQDASGIIKEYQYLPAEKTFNGIVHFPLREVEKAVNGSGSKVIEYVYEDAKNAQGNAFQRLKARVYRLSDNVCQVTSENCGKVYKTEIHQYSSEKLVAGTATTPYSLPSVTKLLSSANGKCKIVQKKQDYLVGKSQNTLTSSYLSSKGSLLAKEVTTENAFTNLVEKKLDSKGIEVSYEYDKLGRKLKETAKADGAQSLQTTYTYVVNDPTFGGYGTSSLLIAKPNGFKGVQVYDSLGRELEVHAQNNSGTGFSKLKSYQYSVTGQKEKETLYNVDSQGNPFKTTIQYKYDAFGREVAVISPSGETKVTEYNGANHTEQKYVKAADGEISPISVVTYNDMNKIVSTQLLKSDKSFYSVSSNKYDAYGNPSESVDVNGNKIKYVYNQIGQKLEEIFPDSRRIKYVYDEIFEDKVVQKSVVLQNGKEVVLGNRTYNELGLMLSDSDPTGNAIKYAYDNKGNMVSQTQRSGNEIKYTYNAFNQMIKKDVAGDSGKYSSSYAYDNLSQKLLSMTDATGKTNYSYHLDNSLESVTYPDNKKISYLYDLQGSMIGITDIANNQTIYHYSKTNGKLEATEFRTMGNNNQVEQYYYDKFGRISSKILPNNAQSIYSYNDMGSLENLSHFAENRSRILSYSYTYKKDMNISSRTRTSEEDSALSAKENYAYDIMNNLSQYNCSGTACPKDQNGQSIASEEYMFDNLNNIKTAKVSFVKGSTSLTTYNYSDKDPSRLVAYATTDAQGTKNSTLEYDADGNVTKDGDGNMLTYSPFNRLETFTKESNVTEYRYNGAGILVSQKDAGNVENKFYYSGSRVLNENAAGVMTSYFQVSGRVIGKVTAGQNTQIFLTDQAHSVIRIMEGRKLLDVNFAYTPYGQQSDLSEKATGAKTSGYGFNGERTDGKSGYQFLGQGYRAYNPALGRFMQYDVHSPFGKGGINGYTFAENNPIMKFDPTGESAASYTVMGIGILLAIIGIIASVVTFGSSLGLTAAGSVSTAASTVVSTATGSVAGAVQVGLATTSLVTGVAAGATGIANEVYSAKSRAASEAGDKNAAAAYAETASALGWASLSLGIISAVTGLGVSFISSKYMKSYSLESGANNKAYKIDDIVASSISSSDKSTAMLINFKTFFDDQKIMISSIKSPILEVSNELAKTGKKSVEAGSLLKRSLIYTSYIPSPNSIFNVSKAVCEFTNIEFECIISENIRRDILN